MVLKATWRASWLARGYLARILQNIVNADELPRGWISLKKAGAGFGVLCLIVPRISDLYAAKEVSSSSLNPRIEVQISKDRIAALTNTVGPRFGFWVDAIVVTPRL